MTYRDNQDWALKHQSLAIKLYYSQVWPECEIKCLDDDRYNDLKKILDISGADKLLKWPDGTISFLAQRFRRETDYDDFTLRLDRPSGYRCEWFKMRDSLKEHKLLPAFYAYGHLNDNEDSFKRFRIVDIVSFLNYWEKGLLTEPIIRGNRDNSSRFLAWHFNEIPDECIIFQDIENLLDHKQFSLSDFMKGSETH